MSHDQTVMWEKPKSADPTPLETGGAVVVLRLTPAEVELLTPLAPTLIEALHHTLDAVAAIGISVHPRSVPR